MFGVSERTARKWWDGETGCNGACVVIALLVHPDAARVALFGEDEEGAR